MPQVRFFGESDDEACGRLRDEERQRGGGGGGNQDPTEKQSNAMAEVDAAYEKIRAEDEADDREEEKQASMQIVALLTKFMNHNSQLSILCSGGGDAAKEAEVC